MNIVDMLPILKCPRTGADLLFEDGRLISKTGEEYPIVNGVPILVRHVQDFHITPPPSQHISKNTANYAPPRHISGSAICLHLGSGAVPSADKRVISMDILPTETVDIVAEAECLPFKDNSLDYIESGAVFEHVVNPLQSIKEVRRTLKSGGEMFIDTAFLQGYHGFPSHYFNMTPQAVEAHLCDDFILEESYVPPAATVTHALTTQFDRFLELIPLADQAVLKAMPLSEALDFMRAATAGQHGLNSKISEYGHRSLAASFAIRATKPHGTKHDSEQDRIDRLAYYAARFGAIQRHHEIELYRRFAAEKHDKDVLEWMDAPSLRDILLACKVTNPREEGAYRRATLLLREWDGNLSQIRNDAIAVYLKPKLLEEEQTPPEPEAATVHVAASSRKWFNILSK
ncbi:MULTISPECIES: methyltransferase domain-containing protein [unclassified Ensifer]|uniref:methyltransferase domain-containing protein n=1 Tax=unclassified Ensifer TaxID=2633371 RepID=UPI00081373A0|nr:MULTISPECIES: methyltransferase domain-containing protein [unclassified Ensifer]OCO99794.1 hypothetical protein BC362_25150 [Ensifer sp. LC14]OCP06123.1 hypothetical protein BBX50_23940 [Ensifer sp. LC11]OCP07073.1 hypothetical protein BC374_24165 [Ensifer sp. LC13]OCP31473.1 hypothetical protein BC364_23490 [Ensifer sp. LC499]